MTDKKISALPASSTPLAGTEVLPLVQSGTTSQVSVANLTAGRAVSASSLTATTGSVSANTSTFSGASLSGVTAASKASTDLIGTYPNGLSFTLVNGGSGWPLGVTQGVLMTYYSNTYSADGIGFSFQEFNVRNPDPYGNRRMFRRYTATTSPGSAWTSWQEVIFADTSTGNAQIASGNLVIGTSGKGIDFSASSHAAGMTSELLNDYEEGTWTPTWAGSGGGGYTLTTAVGYYRKVGSQVTVWFNIVSSSSVTEPYYTFVGGLPYQPNTSAAMYGAAASPQATNGRSCTYQIGGYASAQLRIFVFYAAGAATNFNYANTVYGCATFFV